MSHGPTTPRYGTAPAPQRPEEHPRRIRSCVTALLIVACLTVPGAARADMWYEHYERAKEAIEARSWDEAIKELDSALGFKSDPSDRTFTYGMNFTEYFPYYYMGVALQENDDPDGALQAFAISERFGAVREDEPAWQDLLDRRQRIQRAQEARAEAERRTQQLFDDAIDRAQRLETEDRLEDALVAVEDALSIRTTEDAETLRDRLLQSLVRKRDRDELIQRVADLVGQGQREYAAGNFEKASSLAKQALGLGPSPEADALRVDAESALRSEIETKLAAEERRRQIDGGLERAAGLGDREQFGEAIEALQRVLALDPGNEKATALQQEYLLRQKVLRDAQLWNDRLTRLEQEGDSNESSGQLALAVSQFRQAMIMANSATEPDADRISRISRRFFRAQTELKRQRKDSDDERGQSAPEPRIPNDRRYWAVDAGRRMVQNADPSSDVGGIPVEKSRSPRFERVFQFLDRTTPEIECYRAFSRTLSPREPAPDDFMAIPCGSSVSSLGNDLVLSSVVIETSLEPGQTALRITGTDWTERSATIDYAVVYLRPWYQQAWFRGLLAGSALALVSVLFAYRRKQRSQLRRRHFNPYIAGAPVLGQDNFYGRERLLKRVLQSVHNNSILLYGERRIGKTSLQHRLKDRLTELDDAEFDFFPVYIDLQGVPEERFFATLADEIFVALGPRLDGAEPDSVLHVGTEYQYREFVRDLRVVLNKLEGQSTKKVKLVLLIDEVDTLNGYDPRINQRLRSLFMRNFADKLVTVCSGVAIKKQWESEGSPWYNFFEEIPVEAFRREDAEQLILGPLRGMFKIEDGVVERIIELTNRRPFLIQKLCMSLVRRLHQDNRRRITIQDVEALDRSMEA